MASQAYKEKVNQKKQKQAEEVWSKIAKEPKLAQLLELHSKIKDLEKKRQKNREYMGDVDDVRSIVMEHIPKRQVNKVEDGERQWESKRN